MSHPALALVRCGDVAEAIAYLRQSGDHPAGLALLEAGFLDYAAWCLEDVAPKPRQDASGGQQEAGAVHDSGEAIGGAGDTSKSQETAHQGRAA